ncbi:Uncharacterized protein TCM_044063 [Theobroma cacao]|uniref:Uncharacterized protein n=1 Tax=Theobroma cacao TaxID=3641 RepID=A0A061FRE1_THECC|nr:Uncharacterized protein TCM_044063 [Theobroma cacao]
MTLWIKVNVDYEKELVVTTPLREVFVTRYECRACVVQVKVNDTQANLILKDMLEFDIIHGMDWQSPNYASVD